MILWACRAGHRHMFWASMVAVGEVAETLCGLAFRVTVDDIQLPDELWEVRPPLCPECAAASYTAKYAMRH
ncbi:hypothetical protein EV191_11778 [Tamaricihabitans halophyticus]|uniref:Zinc finger protein n=1 Tax=Tamaricihabitans halophyticus TaxID=1262583 RepID=A0A4R2Q8D0_9PSEU|nr:hypothetical protein [Tamaricihabitans halophyticus]TCP45112.1 hypothetical protein EV191_11778 [Tamaricihabitans halophyticus]